MTTLTRKQQRIAIYHQIDADEMAAIDKANADQIGTKIAEYVNLLGELLDESAYKALRTELVGKVSLKRLAICKKWMSLLLLVDAAEKRKRALPGNPGGMACYKFHKAVEDARACGWVVVTLPYSAQFEMIYWGKEE